MKFNFRKIASVFASAVMLSSTLGFAAAATYPAPFNTGAAVVVGTGTGVAASDAAQAVIVFNDLKSKAVTTEATTDPTGGETYEFTKGSKYVHIGGGLANVTTSLSKDELPTLLADGVYTDDDNDEFDYEQTVTMANLRLTMFDDNDYKENTPTLGYRMAGGENVLNYTITFTDNPLWADLDTTDLTILGKTYYVLSHTTNTTLNLLDTAKTTILKKGESTTVQTDSKSYEVTAYSITGTNNVKLTIDGVTTKSLAVGGTSKLADGSYVAIKDIGYEAIAGAENDVEFSIGSGKLELINGSEIKINDEAVDGLTAEFTNTADSGLETIKISWNVDDDSFVTTDQELVMPAFGALKLAFTGMVYPAQEEIEVSYDGEDSIVLKNFPLKDSTEDINILYTNSSKTGFAGLGKDSTSKLVTDGDAYLTFDGDYDDYFIASYKSGDEAESYMLRATAFGVYDSDANTNKTTIQYRKDGAWVDKKVDARGGNTIELGDVTFTINTIDKANKILTINATGSTKFNTLYSKEGLQVQLPWTNETTATDGTGALGINSTTTSVTSYNLVFTEEDKDDTIGNGQTITVALGIATDKTTVSSVSGGDATAAEIGNTDVTENYVYSALGTKILFDTGGDQDKVTLTYNGGESYGKFFITSPDATTGASSVIVSIKDSEVESYKDKNLFVIGGSCINSAAAKILGSETPLCGEAWTAKTQVGAGQYLIKSIASPYADATSGKVAMLVAGYEAADTTAAVTKAMLSTTATDIGTEIIGPVTA
ncbi:MAG: hypothetical protein ACP5OG_01150 [Candidatus Nanoarchaeia archaeon]